MCYRFWNVCYNLGVLLHYESYILLFIDNKFKGNITVPASLHRSSYICKGSPCLQCSNGLSWKRYKINSWVEGFFLHIFKARSLSKNPIYHSTYTCIQRQN